MAAKKQRYRKQLLRKIKATKWVRMVKVKKLCKINFITDLTDYQLASWVF